MDEYEIIEIIQKLNFPSREDVQNGIKDVVYGRDKESMLADANCLDYVLDQTDKHSQRIAFKGIALVNYLNINLIQVSLRGNVEQAMLITGIVHDFGKLSNIEVVAKSEYIQLNGGVFTEEDVASLRGHPLYSATLEKDPFIRGIIARHHTYQKRAYPEIPLKNYNQEIYGEQNKEVIYLSKLLAFLDAHDASLTRIKGNNGSTRFLTAKESMESLIDAYGGLDLSYDGNILPNVKQTGKNLLTRLYEDEIFGTP